MKLGLNIVSKPVRVNPFVMVVERMQNVFWKADVIIQLLYITILPVQIDA